MNWNVKQRKSTSARQLTHQTCTENLTEEAKRPQQTSRIIREKFTTIIEKGFSMPAASLFRKASISIRKGKLTFSWNQLVESCQILFSKTPYILFKSPKETRPYVTVLFWSHCEIDEKCPVLSDLEIVKKEVTCLGLNIKIDVILVFAPT